MSQDLSFEARAQLINGLAADFLRFSEAAEHLISIPTQASYLVTEAEESPAITKSARLAAWETMARPAQLQKFAFDTRRIDQSITRIPRDNLQYWNRSDQFIDEEDQKKLEIFAKFINPLEEIKTAYGAQPEYFNSYSRILHDLINRVLRVKEADMDIFRPQISYLEQLLFARYRLSMEDIEASSANQLKEIILKKDENLLKRGTYLHVTQPEKQGDTKNQNIVIKDGNQNITQQALAEAIFGNTSFRREGERSVTRTISISITDTVQD